MVAKADSVGPVLTRALGSISTVSEPKDGLARLRVVDLLAVEVEVLSHGGITVHGRR